MKLVRSDKNPILTPTGNSWENKSVFNAAAFEFEGSIHLLYRAQGDDGVSRFGLARVVGSSQIIERKKDPVFEPDPSSEYESLGVEDPRVTLIGKDYYIVYVSASHYPPVVEENVVARPPEWRVRVSLARTKDFRSFIRYGVVVGHIDSKDAALFPEKVENNFVLMHRVIPQVRLAIAPDGRNFKERGPLFGPRMGRWDSRLVGVGAPPIKSQFGWLVFYHGMDEKLIYRIGLALLDLHDPSVVIARTSEPILEPNESYEKEGRVDNVVFPCGAIETDREYLVYYGAADSTVCLASIDREEVLAWAKKEASKSVRHMFEQVGNFSTEETVLRRGSTFK